MTTTLQGEADQMLAAASVDARRVLDSDLVGRAKAAGDPTATAVALRAMGLAAANLDRVDDAVDLLEQAAAIGDLPSQVRLGVLNTYGVVLAWAGNLEEGELILNRVVRAAVGPVRAQALVQRGAIRFRRSNYRGAIADFDRAEALLDRRSLGSTWANLFTNKGLTLVMIGKPRDALRILERATASWVKAGSPMAAATSHHNLGWAAGRLGDIPLALGHFDRAEEEMLQLGGPVGELWRDRADVLAAAGLTADAIATAQKAVAELGKGGHHAAQAEALVRLAETALGGAETALAIESADRAATLFRRQRRSGWAAHSELVGMRARFESNQRGKRDFLRASQLVSALQRFEMVDSSAVAETLAARLAVAVGDLDRASDLVDRLEPARGRLDMRVGVRLAQAELALAKGDRRVSLEQVRHGLNEADRYRAAIGSPEVRAHLATHVADLGRLAMELVEQGSGRELLRWLERTRAGALRFPTVRPSEDEGMARDLSELRALESRLRSESEPDAESVRRRRSRLEERIRRREIRTPASSRVGPESPVGDLIDLLGGRRLVELAVIRRRMVGVIVANHRVRKVELGEVGPVLLAADDIRLGLSRMANLRSTHASREAAVASVTDILDRLDQGVMQHLPGGDSETVLVPPASIQSFPWSLLPGLRHLPHAVAPSARVWARAIDQTLSPGSVVAAAGPDLPQAAVEINAVGRIHPDSLTITPSRATVGSVSAALARSSIAHLACHGRIRSDNPLFSSLQFKDGGLTIYDLERLPSLPRLMVLSACYMGQVSLRPGDEPLGVVASLLTMGTFSIVASPIPVPESSVTRRFMVAFHRRLAAGDPPATALAAARSGLDPTDPLQFLAGAFACYGAG